MLDLNYKVKIKKIIWKNLLIVLTVGLALVGLSNLLGSHYLDKPVLYLCISIFSALILFQIYEINKYIYYNKQLVKFLPQIKADTEAKYNYTFSDYSRFAIDADSVIQEIERNRFNISSAVLEKMKEFYKDSARISAYLVRISKEPENVPRGTLDNNRLVHRQPVEHI